jgi:hypothetical protein
MAVTLAPGGSVLLAGTTVAAEPELAGTILNDDVQTQTLRIYGNDLPFANGTSLQSRVVRSTSDRNLIFAPRLLTRLNDEPILCPRTRWGRRQRDHAGWNATPSK